jgi:Fur family transcriptional regulator, ferric uptake regulator
MTATETLKSTGLRHTAGREALLEVLLRADHALSHGDIDTALGPDHDRVTIYRTLRTFVDKGLIHRVLDNMGDPRYALCRDACGSGHHQHDHVHFKCNACGQTTCLNTVQIPAVVLPGGYVRQETNLLIEGVCADCNA